MTPIEWAQIPLQKYADFTGRASRPEYWWFYLATIIVYVVLSIITSLLGGGTILRLVSLAINLGLVVPVIAAGIRRLHDTDRSGWWLLVPFANLYFLASEGSDGENQYGAPPELLTA